jgi:hypothetical protein
MATVKGNSSANTLNGTIALITSTVTAAMICVMGTAAMTTFMEVTEPINEWRLRK